MAGQIRPIKVGPIQELDLYCNRLVKIPGWVPGLRDSLKKLNISHNSIERILEELSELTKLEILNLGKNRNIIIPDNFRFPNSLTDLYLDSNNIIAVPEKLWDLQKLKTLRLTWNRLSVISDKIGSLSNLTNLDLSYNQITKLPEGLKRCHNLMHISVGNNQLSKPSSLFLNWKIYFPKLLYVDI